MAKKKHRKHTPRRVSGIGGNDSLMMIVGGVLGYVAGNAINTKVTTIDDKIKGIAEVALPIVLSKKLKSPLLKGVGVGIAVAGSKSLGKGFSIAILSGLPVVNGYVGRNRRMNGYPVVNGSADQPYLRTGAAGNSLLSGVPPKVTAPKALTPEELYAGTMMDDYNDN